MLSLAWRTCRSADSISTPLPYSVHGYRYSALYPGSSNHDQVGPNLVQVASSLQHKIDQTFALFFALSKMFVRHGVGRSVYEATHASDSHKNSYVHVNIIIMINDYIPDTYAMASMCSAA